MFYCCTVVCETHSETLSVCKMTALCLLQALQKGTSAGLSASTGKVTTRKRKLAESSSDAAVATAAAGEPDALQEASMTDDQSRHPHVEGQQAAETSRELDQAPVRGRRRTSRHKAIPVTDALLKTEEPVAADSHTQDRQESNELRGDAESERDRRLSARLLRTAADFKAQPCKGQTC